MSDSIDYGQILKNANSILLVDWPFENVPADLIKAGFSVYSYSPDRYSAAEFDGEKLLFRELDGPPATVDIVNVFRPEGEHAAIITHRVLPLKATVLWLHPPIMSAKTAALAAEHGLVFVEGVSIADEAAALDK